MKEMSTRRFTIVQKRRIDYEEISGLTIMENFIRQAEERDLIEHIITSPWDTSLSRRTQHYGYRYDYTSKNPSSEKIPIPDWLGTLFERIDFGPNQCIVNEYQPGQGISAHIDNRKFGPIVATLSLNAEYPMVFTRGSETIEVPLPRRSLAILSGEARDEWKHSIPARKSDHGVARDTRYSLTFRTQ